MKKRCIKNTSHSEIPKKISENTANMKAGIIREVYQTRCQFLFVFLLLHLSLSFLQMNVKLLIASVGVKLHLLFFSSI